MQLQADSIIQTINHLGNTANFKGEQLLSGLHAGTLAPRAD